MNFRFWTLDYNSVYTSTSGESQHKEERKRDEERHKESQRQYTIHGQPPNADLEADVMPQHIPASYHQAPLAPLVAHWEVQIFLAQKAPHDHNAVDPSES